MCEDTYWDGSASMMGAAAAAAAAPALGSLGLMAVDPAFQLTGHSGNTRENLII